MTDKECFTSDTFSSDDSFCLNGGQQFIEILKLWTYNGYPESLDGVFWAKSTWLKIFLKSWIYTRQLASKLIWSCEVVPEVIFTFSLFLHQSWKLKTFDASDAVSKMMYEKHLNKTVFIFILFYFYFHFKTKYLKANISVFPK